MKNIINKSLFALLAGGLFLSSCEKDDNELEIDPGTGLVFQDSYYADKYVSKFSNLEPVEFTAKVFGSVAKVEIKKGEEVLASVDNPTDNVSIKIEREALTGFDKANAGRENANAFVTLNDGRQLYYPIRFDLSQAVEVAGPENAPINKVDLNSQFTYAVNLTKYKHADIVKNLVVETKINSQDWTQNSSKTWSIEKGTLDFSNASLNVGDTINFRVTATSKKGSTSTSSAYTIIQSREFATKKEGAILAGIQKYDIVSDSIDAEIVNDLQIKVPSLIEQNVGVEALNGLELIASDSATYVDADLNKVMELYAATAADKKLSKVTNLTKDNVFIFKTTRTEETKKEDGTKETKNYKVLGILKVAKVVRPDVANGVSTPSFTIDYRFTKMLVNPELK